MLKHVEYSHKSLALCSKVAWIGALAVTLGTTTACEPPPNSAVMSIDGNIVPQALKLNGGLVCTYTAAQTFYFSATIDLAQTTTLQFFAQVRNNLVPSTQINTSLEPQLRNDHNIITITKVHVVMERPAVAKNISPFDGGTAKFGKAAPAIAEWDVPASGVVYPANRAAIAFDLVPHQTKPGTPVGADFQARFGAIGFTDKYKYVETAQLRFTLQGTTASGKTVVAGEVSYPVTFCWGCLLFPMIVDQTAPSAGDVWKSCTTVNLGAEFLPACQTGAYEYTPCRYYCDLCKINESIQLGPKCDAKFCPPPPTP